MSKTDPQIQAHFAKLKEYEQRLDEAVERGKREILGEIDAGRFTADDIKGFKDLHDYIDANMLGGLCDETGPASSSAFDTNIRWLEFGNALQERLHQWIKDGGLTGFYLAELETRNFSFQAAGRTREEALDALKAGWESHQQEYGPGVVSWEEISWGDEEVQFIHMHLGKAYRDREELH